MTPFLPLHCVGGTTSVLVAAPAIVRGLLPGPMILHVLPQARGIRVTFRASLQLTGIRFL